MTEARLSHYALYHHNNQSEYHRSDLSAISIQSKAVQEWQSYKAINERCFATNEHHEIIAWRGNSSP